MSTVRRPLDTVHIDETMLDCLVRVGYGPGEFFLRPNLSTAYCSWSELVLGHDLFFDSPSIASVLMTLRDLYERHGRFPNRLVLDRAPWFGSTALDELCAAALIQKVQRPPGHPQVWHEGGAYEPDHQLPAGAPPCREHAAPQGSQAIDSRGSTRRATQFGVSTSSTGFSVNSCTSATQDSLTRV